MDLSSLEGPPTLDDRFCFTISSPSPVSPVASSATWERWEQQQQQQQTRRQQSIPTPISPLSDSSRSFSSTPPSLPSTLRRPHRGSFNGSDGGYSNHYYSHSHDRPVYQSPNASRLRSSRSFSTLQAPTSVPPRPASADNHASSSAPRLITNGRLVWLDEQQIWVLMDTPLPQTQQTTTRDLPRARNLDTVHVAQHSSNPLIQYYDPFTHEDQILRDGAMPPPSYESHRFSMGRLYPQRITIPAPPQPPHHSDRPPRSRTQWASVAERLGRSPLA
ncbi:hypothetical protein PISL3812_02833 [Talaromyces islandicus]|uniref:Uncharacterized protein n=1 Tax=Talaromyces islandicus TaxID=28573 RepID=A0A0U1LT96_TALIS|nr:hypothetical protein PISL3812_02833 [Talaromyces islandicus]